MTVAQAQEIARRKKHMLEARALGLDTHEADEELRKTPPHVAATKYLAHIEEFRKSNTERKYRAVLNRFLAFVAGKATAQSITGEDLNGFMVHLKKEHKLDNNSVIHNLVS